MLGLNELGEKIKEYRETIHVETPSELGPLVLAKLMRVVMEVAEAGEAVRNMDMENFKEEMADVFMLASDICATMKIDIDFEIEKKYQKLLKEKRPILHGKKLNI